MVIPPSATGAGQAEQPLADTGYWSQADLAAWEAACVELFIAVVREFQRIDWIGHQPDPGTTVPSSPLYSPPMMK